jgi:hypothetical protein
MQQVHADLSSLSKNDFILVSLISVLPEEEPVKLNSRELNY